MLPDCVTVYFTQRRGSLIGTFFGRPLADLSPKVSKHKEDRNLAAVVLTTAPKTKELYEGKPHLHASC
jgi:hypothetical protein